MSGINEGELWSLISRVLGQGGAIQQDYMAGKYKCYEEYSARLDEAARERVSEFVALVPPPDTRENEA